METDRLAAAMLILLVVFIGYLLLLVFWLTWLMLGGPLS